jgi:hypothetical protein
MFVYFARINKNRWKYLSSSYPISSEIPFFPINFLTLSIVVRKIRFFIILFIRFLLIFLSLKTIFLNFYLCTSNDIFLVYLYYLGLSVFLLLIELNFQLTFYWHLLCLFWPPFYRLGTAMKSIVYIPNSFWAFSKTSSVYYFINKYNC